MRTFYEELLERHLSALELPYVLASTIPYEVQIDLIWGVDNITYKPVKISQN